MQEEKENQDKLITIIIPYYNVLEYTLELFKVLTPQLTDDIEVILIDDGCNEKELDNLKANIIHLDKNSGGASVPRNTGLDMAKGKYIVFIDADDLISDDFIETLKEATKEDWDYCYYSWKCRTCDVIIKDNPPYWNTCVWNCIYKKELIGDNRFNPDIIIGEDKDFNLRVRHGTYKSIEKIIYFYNIDVPNSLIKRTSV